MKLEKLKRISLIALLATTTLAMTGCEDEEEYEVREEYETKHIEKEETVYVKDSDGNWMEMFLFMSLMNNRGTPVTNYNSYQFSTKDSSGGYKSYKPSSTEIKSMNKGNYSGKSLIKSTVTVPKSVSAPKSSSTGKTTTVGGSSSRSSSSIGG